MQLWRNRPPSAALRTAWGGRVPGACVGPPGPGAAEAPLGLSLGQARPGQAKPQRGRRGRTRGGLTGRKAAAATSRRCQATRRGRKGGAALPARPVRAFPSRPPPPRWRRPCRCRWSSGERGRRRGPGEQRGPGTRAEGRAGRSEADEGLTRSGCCARPAGPPRAEPGPGVPSPGASGPRAGLEAAVAPGEPARGVGHRQGGFPQRCGAARAPSVLPRERRWGRRLSGLPAGAASRHVGVGGGPGPSPLPSLPLFFNY